MMEVGSFVHLGCVDLNEMGTVDEDEVTHTLNMRSIHFCCRLLDNCIVSNNNFAVVTVFIIVMVVAMFHHYSVWPLILSL